MVKACVSARSLAAVRSDFARISVTVASCEFFSRDVCGNERRSASMGGEEGGEVVSTCVYVYVAPGVVRLWSTRWGPGQILILGRKMRKRESSIFYGMRLSPFSCCGPGLSRVTGASSLEKDKKYHSEFESVGAT